MGDTAIATIVVGLLTALAGAGGGWYLQRKQGDATIVDSAGGFAKTMIERLDKVEAKNDELKLEIDRLRWRVLAFERHIERLETLLDSEGLEVPMRPDLD